METPFYQTILKLLMNSRQKDMVITTRGGQLRGTIEAVIPENDEVQLISERKLLH